MRCARTVARPTRPARTINAFDHKRIAPPPLAAIAAVACSKRCSGKRPAIAPTDRAVEGELKIGRVHIEGNGELSSQNPLH
jgi:hypothetical protein